MKIKEKQGKARKNKGKTLNPGKRRNLDGDVNEDVGEDVDEDVNEDVGEDGLLSEADFEREVQAMKREEGELRAALETARREREAFQQEAEKLRLERLAPHKGHALALEPAEHGEAVSMHHNED